MPKMVMAQSLLKYIFKNVESFGSDWYGYRMEDGYIIAWKTLSGSAAITNSSTAFGGYRSDSLIVTLPSDLFTDRSSMNVFSELNSFEGVRLVGINAETTSRIEFYLSKAESQSSYNYKISVLVIGK